MNIAPIRAPGPSIISSAVILIGIFFCWGNLRYQLPASLLTDTALILGIALAISFMLEAVDQGFKGLIRLDIAALGVLYVLLFIEYVTLQPEVNDQTTNELISVAVRVALLGFAGITIGRHLIRPTLRVPIFAQNKTRPQDIELLLYLCLIGGFGYMLFKVHFNPLEMIHQMMRPRFSQPWGRGRFGNLSTLLYEIGIVKMILPPLCGFIMAQPGRVSKFTYRMSYFILLFVIFFGFTSGTRSVLASQLITFMASFAFFAPARKRTSVIFVLLACTLFMLISINLQLSFRKMGLGRYLQGERTEYMQKVDNIQVDNNIVVMAEVIDLVPDQIDYLGFEIPYLALIRPIPRALWKSKPEGLSVSIEEIYGTESKGLGSTTLATTFLGESFLSAGYFGTCIAAIMMGMFCAWGNRFSSVYSSEVGIILFALLFFVVAMTSRSLFSFAPSFLPFVALVFYSLYFIHAPKPVETPILVRE